MHIRKINKKWMWLS